MVIYALGWLCGSLYGCVERCLFRWRCLALVGTHTDTHRHTQSTQAHTHTHTHAHTCMRVRCGRCCFGLAHAHPCVVSTSPYTIHGTTRYTVQRTVQYTVQHTLMLHALTLHTQVIISRSGLEQDVVKTFFSFSKFGELSLSSFSFFLLFF